MAKQHRNIPYEQGIREFFGKRYIWLINYKGNLELHGLHHAPPQDSPAAAKRMMSAIKEHDQRRGDG
jgi:hypothetical protein